MPRLSDGLTIEQKLDVYADLDAVAADFEADILHQLAVKAGWLWDCGPCGWYNPTSLTHCEECGVVRGTPKPEDEDEVDEEEPCS